MNPFSGGFREKRSGGEEKQAQAWGCLAPGGAGPSDTTTRKGPNLREYLEPHLKLEIFLAIPALVFCLGAEGYLVIVRSWSLVSPCELHWSGFRR